jgi:hypothetical protein
MRKNQHCGVKPRPPPSAARLKRRSQLEETVRALGGVLGPTRDFDDHGDPIQLLIAAETAPLITHGAWLRRHGLAFMAPDALRAQELAGELRRLIQALAFARVFLSCTDHLSDAALYAWLWAELLNTEEPDVPRSENEAFHWDLSLAGADNNDIWLTYYASEEERAEWADEFTEDPLPPMLPRPFHRDDDLPQPHLGR